MSHRFSRALVLSLVTAIAALAVRPAAATPPAERIHRRVNPTKESLLAHRDALLKARDALRELAAQPAPKRAPAGDTSYADFVASIKELANICDETATAITNGVNGDQDKRD